MKAWYKIHDKPRGRWRPLMQWGLTFTPTEATTANELNVDCSVKYCIRHSVQSVQIECHSSDYFVLILPDAYSVEQNKAGTSGHWGYYSPCPYSSPSCKNARGYYSQSNTYPENRCLQWSIRLPWRPGARPDYSDFIEPVRDFLRRVLEELERRFAEARESAPSDEWAMEEEFDSFSWRTLDNGLEVAERKLRVIRR